MEAHYKKHKKCRSFRNAFPEDYDLFKDILGSRMADGREAVGAKNLLGSPAPKEEVDEAEEPEAKRRKGGGRATLREQALANASSQLAEIKGFFLFVELLY